MMFRKWLSLALVVCMTLLGTAALADNEWSEENGLNKTETVEELYQAALAEGGVLNLYGCTGRDETVAQTFMEEYPGITVNFYDLGINEMLEKFSREYEAGIYTADVLQLAEKNGGIYYDYIQTGMMHNYQPEDIFEGVDPSYLFVTPYVIELNWWSYNSELYDTLPFTSWWDLTKEEWNGKFTMLDPTRSSDMIVLFSCLIQNADLMAEDYERVFGEPIVLADDEPTAAHAWIKRMARNGIIIESSDSNIAKDVGGTTGMTEAPVGYGISAMLRKRDQQGYVLGVDPDAFEDKTPTSAISFVIVEIADHCEHPNAAKLFVRYICGEVGHTGEGLAPFQVAGSYQVFPDAPDIPFEQPSFDEIHKFDLDMEYYYESYYDVYDYWLSVQG